MYGPTWTVVGAIRPPLPVRLASKCAGVSSPAPPGFCSGDVEVDVVGVSGAFAAGRDCVLGVVGGAFDGGVGCTGEAEAPPPHPAHKPAAAIATGGPAALRA